MQSTLLRTRASCLAAARSFHLHRSSRRTPSVAPLVDTTPELRLNPIPNVDNDNNNTRTLINKSTWELARGLGILSACNNQWLVANCLSLMQQTRRVFGDNVFRMVLGPTFYRQFVGGESEKEILKCVENLHKSDVRALLAMPYEECEDGVYGNEHVFNNNCASILECLNISACLSDIDGSAKMQLKTSGIMATGVLEKIGKLYQESTRDNKLKLIESLSADFRSNSVNVEPYKHILSLRELDCLKSGIERHREIAQFAESNKVKILVDAELTSQNPGISVVTLGLMGAFNKQKPLIWNTYQCYLKKTFEYLMDDLDITKRMGVSFGAKLVRGAYIVQENQIARNLNQESPICDSYNDTNIIYNIVARYLLNHLKRVGADKCQFIVASHNEDSIKQIVEMMQHFNIKEGVVFGQLYGMCDPTTFSLAQNGYEVYKSIPYGPMETVLPYLARRAAENQSVLGGTRKERELLWAELRHRFKPAFVNKLAFT